MVILKKNPEEAFGRPLRMGWAQGWAQDWAQGEGSVLDLMSD